MKNKKIKFHFVIGIDQTGSIKKDNTPKPLYVTIFDVKKNLFYTNLFLNDFQFNSLKQLFKKIDVRLIDQKCLILVDAALGLPKELKISIHDLLKRAKSFSFNKKLFGMDVAERFYRSFLSNAELNNWPTRQCEVLTKANSVFQKHPFQKNIGCGSFRILKQLANADIKYKMGPFQKMTPKDQFYIYETYPSWIWKNIFHFDYRESTLLEKKLKIQFLSMDHSDSYISTLFVQHLIQLNQFDECLNLKLNQSITKYEGWIFGLKN